MKEALLYDPLEGGKVLCTACARYCKIGEGQIGLCGIRQNLGGKLQLLVYGKVIAGHVDPIEKKPVTHYMPGAKIFSIATTGCNWLCHPAGAEILLIDGTTRKVEEVAPGDAVWSYDLGGEPEAQPGIVTHVGTRIAQIWEIRHGPDGSERILLTEEHPVWTNVGWKTVGDLRPGDRILRMWPQTAERLTPRPSPALDGTQLEGIEAGYLLGHPEEVEGLIAARQPGRPRVNRREWRRVTSVGSADRVEMVYSLETIPHHNYVADGIVVHNCQYCIPGESTISTDHGMLPVSDLWSRGVSPRRTENGEVVDLEGIRVWTHRGRLQRVGQVHRHFYSDDLLEIQPVYKARLRCTPDHRVFASRRHGGKVQKVPARKLREGDLVALPKTSPRPEIPVIDARSNDYAARVLVQSMDVGPQAIEWTPRSPQAVETPNYFLLPIRSITRLSYVGHVYNLAVEKDHSYVADFVAVANCQNYDISQRRKVQGTDISPQGVVDLTLEQGAQGIAYTYNQPTIFIEFAHDIGVLARKAGLINIFVSNGYDTPETVAMMRDFLDAITVDFKGNGEPKFVRRYIGVPDPQPIFDSLIEMRDKTDVHIEITDLVVPEVGDDLAYARKLARFVYDELGPDTPIHFLRFHPDYKMVDLPLTPVETLERHHRVAQEAGLKYVYIGNVPGHPLEHTYCPGCGRVAIRRHGFDIRGWDLDDQNRCRACGYQLPIVGDLQESWQEFRFRPVM